MIRRNPNARILYVLPTEKIADERWYQLGKPEEIHCCSLAHNIAGYRYDEIWIDEDYIQVLEPRLWSEAQDRIELMYTRLSPGGRVRKLS